MARYAPLQYKTNFSSVYENLKEMQMHLGGPALSEFMSTDIYPYLRERALQRFDNHGDDASGRWPALKSVTQQIRSSYGYGASGPINVRTGELLEFVERSSPQLIIGSDSVTLRYPGDVPSGNLGKKYTTAQRGSKKPRTASRPVVALSPTDFAYITQRLEDYVMNRGM